MRYRLRILGDAKRSLRLMPPRLAQQAGEIILDLAEDTYPVRIPNHELYLCSLRETPVLSGRVPRVFSIVTGNIAGFSIVYSSVVSSFALLEPSAAQAGCLCRILI